MGSDRARVTYDATRMWRGVVAQQGRVSLEADWNESIDIQAAAVRELTLDVVGPEGTPDCGYVVSSVSKTSKGNASNQDVSVSAGVLYLGGERLRLPGAIKYSSQPDWLDSATDPTYTAISAIPASTTEELIYLTAAEQEVSAVEDPALSDVAIGGPDTAQRLRILQRVRRVATTATTCPDAFTQLQTQWTKQGYRFDQSTMRLASTATLAVGYSTPLTQGTPCQPAATGGYIWPENQMYRVEIVALAGNGNPILAWGPDDASFIYRVTASPESGGTTTLTLATAPVDTSHYPQAGQAVQLLASAVQLDKSTASYVASPTGIVTTLNAAYQADSQQIPLNEPAAGPIPAEYFDTNATPQLFVRIWQGTGTATPGVAFHLTDTQNNIDTGLTVTLTQAPGFQTSGFHVGDFWRFALRPIEPAQIYPARYMNNSPQPPDGPQTWAGPLAVINWSGSTPQVTDCRPCFLSLTGGIRPTEVLAKDDDNHDIPLKNGVELRAQNLSKGLRLLLNQDIDPATANEPACFVTFQLPYPLTPLNTVDQNIWGSSTIGYQPLVLPADVTTGTDDHTILWQPLDHVGLFFAGPDRLEAMKRRLPPGQFASDWQIFDPQQGPATDFLPSQWSYREDSVVQTAFTGEGISDVLWGFNTNCVSVHRLQTSAYYVGLTFNIYPAAPPSPPQVLWQNAGLVFNWVDNNNYCVLTCRWVSGRTSQLFIDFVNVAGGTVAYQYQVNQLNSPATPNANAIVNTVSLNLKPTSAGLLVLAQAWFTTGSGTVASEATFSLDPHQYLGVPQTLLNGSGIGMCTRFATAEFTRLEVVYPESRTVLIPRGGSRILATMTLKPDFLLPATSSESSQLPSTCAGQPQSDFERWFWVLPPLIPYAYAYAYGYGLLEFLGVGPELLDEPGEGT